MRLPALIVAATALAVPAAAGAQPDPPPNIVIIFADDLGYADLRCYGQTRWRTPNIDRLADEGVRFTDFYAAQAVCSASRAALLTGCYPNRVGIAGALGPQARSGLHPDETSLAEVCASRGYATAIFGKWHLGGRPPLLPTFQGFDEFCGLICSNDMWPLHPDLVRLPPDHPRRGYPPLALWEGDRIADEEITAEDQAQFTRTFTRRAVEFIRRNAGRPFFLYVPHPMPHVPLFTSPEFAGRSGAGPYGDVIEEIDWSVGEIVAELERLDLARRTLVVFTSDNGPWLSYGEHAGTTGGLREGKGTSWEGGVRVPMIAWWPGSIAPGQVRRTPAMTIDILPTVAGLIGADLPGRPIDGVDIGPALLRGEDAGLAARPLAFYYHENHLQAVRRGRWKLILPHAYRTLDGPPGEGGVPGKYRQADAGLELYDLDQDPRESRDLATQRPEVVGEMLEVAAGFRADLGDALIGAEGGGRRAAGRVDAAGEVRR